MKQYTTHFLLFILIGIFLTNCDKDENKTYPLPPSINNTFDEEIKVRIPTENIEHTTVFSAGDDNINSYRIPTMTTSKNGVLIAAAEARRNSWRDKSPTDIAVKRSTDGGKTWSKTSFITDEAKNQYAFMDPCLISDFQTGRVFLFACRWPETPQDATANTAFLMTSDDDGLTWSQPINVSDQVIFPGGFIHGFGPGSGLQMKGEKFKNRLILPSRQMNTERRSRNRTVYSDDHGETWQVGEEAPRSGEYQIAETSEGTLYYNLRLSNGRAAAYSQDGGNTWGNDILDSQLPGVTGGCHSSVLGDGEVVLYCGIQGGTANNTYDNRNKLTLYRSTNSALKWGNKHLLYEKAAGYSCMTQLANGDIAILFEAGNEQGFIKSAVRPAGWMRLDLMIVPKEVLIAGHWF